MSLKRFIRNELENADDLLREVNQTKSLIVQWMTTEKEPYEFKVPVGHHYAGHECRVVDVLHVDSGLVYGGLMVCLQLDYPVDGVEYFWENLETVIEWEWLNDV